MTKPATLWAVDVEAIIPVSRTSTRAFKTGQWGSRKPAYREKLSPCREACPAGNDIAGALSYAAKGDFDEALALILQENPLPGVCGRVCYHPCQTTCNRSQFDEAVEVRAMERAAADYGNAAPRSLRNPADRTINAAVIGSGPAGLSAAYFLALFGHRVTVFESRAEAGGVLRYGIPEYRLPKDVLKREIARIAALGVDIRCGETIDAKGFDGLRERFDYIFLGTGAWLPQTMELASQIAGSVVYGLNFLSDERKEVLLQERKKVLVVGGGDVAVDVARTARRLCRPDAEITMVAPEKEGDFPAIPEGITEAREEGIRMVGGYRPVALMGNGRLEKVRLAGTKVEKDPATGRYVLSPVDGDEMTVEADLVLVAIGQLPDTGLFLPEIVDGERSRVVIDDTGMTPFSPFYAGGDLIRQRPAVADAILSGKRAALAIHLKANGHDPRTIMPALTLGQGSSLSVNAFTNAGRIDLTKVVQFAELNTLLYRKKGPNRIARTSPETRLADFSEVSRGLTRDEAVDEAKRCFYCGSCIECDLCFYFCPDISILKEGPRMYSVDEDYCKGCSICATTCPRHVIEMEEGE